jgi:hypothetical protein
MDFKQATDLLAVSLEEVASAVGKSYATILAYRTGDRMAPKSVKTALAAYMRERADTLMRAADQLDRIE